MSDDTQLDNFIDGAAKGYRAGGKPPADAMWSRIEGEVARAIQRPAPSLTRHWPWLAAGVGIAAALVIGINIGRRSATNASLPGVVSRDSGLDSGVDLVRNTQMRALTMNHFAQAEVFLTEVRTDLTTGRHNALRGGRSRELLARTRLIMSNDAGSVPQIERLLQDLELVLAEIAALPDSGTRGSIDARLLTERLRAGTILPRIRTLLPAPSVTGGP